MRVINVEVAGYHVRKDAKVAGAMGEGNAAYLRITFCEDWALFAKSVTFFNALGESPTVRTLTTDRLEDAAKSSDVYLCPIPPEAMTDAGMLTFVIDGYREGVRQRSVEDTLEVKYSRSAEGAMESADPTPSQAEQLQGQIDTIIGDIQTARASAVAAVAAAESAGNSATSAAESAENAEEDAKAAQAAKEAAEKAAENAQAAAGGDFATNTALKAVEEKVNAAQEKATQANSTAQNAAQAAENAQATADSKAAKAVVSTTAMTAAGWIDKQYSFEAAYPNAQYDISIEVAPTATAEQFEAFGAAMICGSATENIATALGDVPAVDIPIIIKAVAK